MIIPPGDAYEFTGTLEKWHDDAHGTWHFLPVTGATADALDAAALMHRLETGRRSGFGSVRLTIRVGATTWQTSAFPMKERGWAIPVSAKVRKAEKLTAGDRLDVSLTF
ncbi:DUF1905 domain-containing protein [Novosphingobium sp.]|uniref:DUF1905 domain-containing protein n=1 Tax=Novosphingobium sp. TaxID=1874826 RepID=UPI00333FFB8B